jgi:hypothetical protein
MGILLNIPSTGGCESGIEFEKVMGIMKTLDTPSKVRVFLKDYKYEKDRSITIEPMIKNPFLFYKDKKGDCKDFANFAYRCGILHDQDVSFMSVYPKDATKNGHAFCVWRVNNNLYILCNYTCNCPSVKFEFKSITEIGEFYRKVFKWDELREPPREAFPLPYGLLYYPKFLQYKETPSGIK